MYEEGLLDCKLFESIYEKGYKSIDQLISLTEVNWEAVKAARSDSISLAKTADPDLSKPKKGKKSQSYKDWLFILRTVVGIYNKKYNKEYYFRYEDQSNAVSTIHNLVRQLSINSKCTERVMKILNKDSGLIEQRVLDFIFKENNNNNVKFDAKVLPKIIEAYLSKIWDQNR